MSDSVGAALLAIAAALCIAVGTVVRQRTAAGVPDDAVGTLGPITALVRNPVWWLGTVAGVGGYAFQAAALGRGSLLLVQPLLVLSLLFALPLGARLADRSVGRSEWLWAAALTGSVAVLVVLGNRRPGLARAEPLHWVLTCLVGAPLVAAGLIAARRVRGARKALLLGAVGGALFGVSAVLTKGVVDIASRGVLPLATAPELWALLLLAAGAVTVQQAAFQAGDLRASLPATTVLEPVVASLLGFVVLGEYLDADRAMSVVLVTAAAVMVAATVALARGDAAASSPDQAVCPPGE